MMSSKPLYINPESDFNNSNLKHFREGKEKGAKENAIGIAHNITASGVDINVVLSTGLSKEHIKKL